MESELGGDKIAKILSLYVDISPEWLLSGIGSMLKTDIMHDSIVEDTRAEYRSEICKLCIEKDKTIEAMKLANKALQVALDALQRQYNNYNSHNEESFSQTG